MKIIEQGKVPNGDYICKYICYNCETKVEFAAKEVTIIDHPAKFRFFKKNTQFLITCPVCKKTCDVRHVIPDNVKECLCAGYKITPENVYIA
jgi:hypothetical protein